MDCNKDVGVAKKSNKKDDKKVVVPRTLADIQRFKLEKLLKNPDKPVFIPEKREPKLPRVFNPPEFVRNIWGSSAGAGSGDFHVYRGVRRREFARQKYLDEKSAKDQLDEEFQKSLVKHKQEEIERTNKKRAKRLKKKQKAKGAKKSKVIKKNESEKRLQQEFEQQLRMTNIAEDEDASDSSGADDSENEDNDSGAAVNSTATISSVNNDRLVTSDGEERLNSGSDNSAVGGNKSDNSISSTE